MGQLVGPIGSKSETRPKVFQKSDSRSNCVKIWDRWSNWV